MFSSEKCIKHISNNRNKYILSRNIITIEYLTHCSNLLAVQYTVKLGALKHNNQYYTIIDLAKKFYSV